MIAKVCTKRTRMFYPDYVDFFSNMRPHQKSGMLTPSAAEEKFATGK